MITLIFPASGGRKMKAELPYVAGRTLRQYLRDPELRKYNALGMSLRMRRLDQDRRRLKMRSQISDGSTIHLMQPGQT